MMNLRGRWNRLAQLQAGAAPGAAPGAVPQGATTAVNPVAAQAGDTTLSPAKQNVKDKQNLNALRQTLVSLNTQVQQHQRMISELEQKIIARGQGTAV